MVSTPDIEGLEYSGDCDIEHGGTYYNMNEFKNGYVSACEFYECQEHDDCVVGNKITIPWDCYKKADTVQALKSYGHWFFDARKYYGDRLPDLKTRQLYFIEALKSYGYFDPMNVYPCHNEEHFNLEQKDVESEIETWVSSIL